MNLNLDWRHILKVDSSGNFRKKIGKVFYEFSTQKLTGFGGLVPLAEFLERLGVESTLGRLNLGYAPTVYPVGRILTCLLLGREQPHLHARGARVFSRSEGI